MSYVGSKRKIEEAKHKVHEIVRKMYRGCTLQVLHFGGEILKYIIFGFKKWAQFR